MVTRGADLVMMRNERHIHFLWSYGAYAEDLDKNRTEQWWKIAKRTKKPGRVWVTIEKRNSKEKKKIKQLPIFKYFYRF